MEEKLKEVIENGKKEIVWHMENDGFIDNSEGVESLPIQYYKKVPEEYADIVLNSLDQFLKEKYKNISLIEPSGNYIGFYYPKDEHYESLEDFKKEKGIIIEKEDDFLNAEYGIEPQI